MKYTEQLSFAHLVEEVGELATEYVNKEARKGEYSTQKLENAIADIFMMLIQLIKVRGLDLEKLVLKAVEEEKKRLLE